MYKHFKFTYMYVLIFNCRKSSCSKHVFYTAQICVFKIARSLRYLRDTSAAVIPMLLSNFQAMRWFKLPISRLRVSMTSHDKTSYHVLKRDPISQIWRQPLRCCNVDFGIFSIAFVAIGNIDPIVSQSLRRVVGTCFLFSRNWCQFCM